MPATQVLPGAPSNVSLPDQQLVTQLGGKAGEGVVTELHGKYYNQNYRGNLFMISTVGAGLAIPVLTTTAPTMVLWNPLGSGKNAVLVRYAAANTNSGTAAAGAIFLMADFNAGNTIATEHASRHFSRRHLERICSTVRLAVEAFP